MRVLSTVLGLGMRAGSFFWFAFFMFATLQYCTMYGIMAVAVTPNLMMAAVLSSAFYSVWNLFAGFIIPKPVSLLHSIRAALSQSLQCMYSGDARMACC